MTAVRTETAHTPIPEVGSPQESRLDRMGIPHTLRWGFLGLLLIMTAVGIESNFLEPHMSQVLSTSGTTVAAIVTWHNLAVAIGSYLGGALADLFGPKKVMALGAAIWVAFHALFLIALSAGSMELAAAAYFARGFGFPLFAFAFIVWIAAVAPNQRRSTAIGWFYVMYTGGLPTLGSLIAIGAIPAFGGGGVGGPGETGALWLATGIAVLGFLIAHFGVREQRGTRRLAPAGETATQVLTAGVRLTATNGKILMGFLIRLINTAPQFGMFIVLPAVWTTDAVWGHGWSQSQYLSMLVAVFATNILVNAVFGAIGDRWGWRRTVKWFGITGSAIGLLAWWYVPYVIPTDTLWGYVVSVAAGCIFGCLLAGFVPMGAIMPALTPDHKGAAMAMYTTAAGGAIFLGTAVVWLVRQISELAGLDLADDAFLINSIIVWAFVALYACAWVMINFLRVPEDEEKEKYGKLFGKKEVSER